MVISKKFLISKCLKVFFNIDMPVYVDYDSADVWANQSLFQLDKKTSLPKAVSGEFFWFDQR